jgi:hypothetical protein
LALLFEHALKVKFDGVSDIPLDFFNGLSSGDASWKVWSIAEGCPGPARLQRRISSRFL